MLSALLLFLAVANAQERVYTVYTDQLRTWAEAKAFCESRSPPQELAIIQSAEDNANAAAASCPSGNLGRNNNCNIAWIGFHDLDNGAGVMIKDEAENMHRWYTGVPICYTNWNFEEPNNLGEEDCTHINWDANDAMVGGWNDKECTEGWYTLCSTVVFSTGCVVAGGDVHVSTLSQLTYTFNAAGDFEFANNEHIEMQTRSAMITSTWTSVYSSFALKDKQTGNICEIWWDGKSADDVVFNSRVAGTSTNKLVEGTEMENGNVVVYDGCAPFLITKYKLKTQFEIKHVSLIGFKLTGYYWGRSTFDLRVPSDWNNRGLSGVGSNGVYKICSRDGLMCLDPETAKNRELHNVGVSWKVTDEDTLFEKPMFVQEEELEYHPLTFSLDSLERARQLCGSHQPCLFDYLATGNEQFANHTRKDFPTVYKYIGDKL